MQENTSKHNISSSSAKKSSKKVISQRFHEHFPRISQDFPNFPQDFPRISPPGSQAALLVLGRRIHGDFIRDGAWRALAAVLAEAMAAIAAPTFEKRITNLQQFSWMFFMAHYG